MSIINNKNNKIYSWLIILVSLFILVLFTKWQFEQIQISLDEKRIEESKHDDARNKLQKLNEIETKLNQEEKTISQYINNFSEDDIIEYIYNEIEDKNLGWEKWITTVRSLSIQDSSINELWFMESSLILNLRVPSLDRMKEILDFFVNEDSKYKFFIESFTMPNNISENWFNITIPLKVFYK